MQLIDYPQYIDKYAINYLNEVMRANSDCELDNETFNEWLIANEVEKKSNPSAYLKACFKRELLAGTFKAKPKVNYIPNTQPLINAMMEKGICVSCDESAYVYELWHYLLNVKRIDYRECMELNHKVLDYMKAGQSFTEYKDLLQNSNTLKKYDVDWELIDKNTEKAIKEWNDLLEDMKESEEEE